MAALCKAAQGVAVRTLAHIVAALLFVGVPIGLALLLIVEAT
jgi:hypothetical protein